MSQNISFEELSGVSDNIENFVNDINKALDWSDKISPG